MYTRHSVKNINCDVCVVGGGLSGCFAAIEAARNGVRVVLMQDRPVLGGNASSEVRMWVRGANGKFDRETGLISELEERNIYYNPTLCHSVFDATLYGMVEENKNIELLMNTTCLDSESKNGKIVSVTGWQLTTYTYYRVEAAIFIDCSGDSVLADMVVCPVRILGHPHFRILTLMDDLVFTCYSVRISITAALGSRHDSKGHDRVYDGN